MATSTPPSASIGTGFRHMYVNGKWTDSSSGETFDVVNLATETVLSSVSAGTTQDVDRAVAAARAQFDGGEWSKMPGPQRSRLL
jgi:acyl-CoA reductase-like NAD-dependent aldehyde dehydrogenase